jgi:hypothetical protein
METTLFDGHGHPVAYIAEDNERSIYLWSGHAVAYLVNETLYGWNGKHLGWFASGVMCNLKGERVGSVREKCPYTTFLETSKFSKFTKFTKFTRFTPYSRPTLSSYYSNEGLEGFLKQGR